MTNKERRKLRRKEIKEAQRCQRMGIFSPQELQAYLDWIDKHSVPFTSTP